MKAKNRNRLLHHVLTALRGEPDAQKRYQLFITGESLLIEYKHLKRKDVQHRLEQLTGMTDRNVKIKES